MSEAATTEEIEIQIVLPAVSDEPLSDMLREITRAIEARDPEIVARGFLGGSDGYGAHWDNDTFTMRPYYWGDCDCGAEERSNAWWEANPHSDACYQAKLECEERAAGVHWTQGGNLPAGQWTARRNAIYRKLCKQFALPREGCAVHCTCGVKEAAEAADIGHRPTCALELPNFLHKQSGLEVRWYKYIGRGMETKNMPSDLSPILAACLASLKG